MPPQEVTGKDPSLLMSLLVNIGLLLIMAGAAIPIFTMGQSTPIARWIFAAGAVMTLAGRLFSPYTGKALRVKRLHRIESWSAIFFCVAAFFMFYDTTSSRDWLAFTLAGGAIQVYASIMLPIAIKKALKE
ncbi:MAG: hypothetical protein K2L81_07430 [Muribaculaceae bacterium]|nr:hypothetical protein [Muribaculaceae bacterium]